MSSILCTKTGIFILYVISTGIKLEITTVYITGRT